MRQQLPDMLTRQREIAGSLQCQRQSVFVLPIGGIDLIRSLKQGNRLRISARIEIKIAKLTICLCILGSTRNRCTKLAFRFAAFVDSRSGISRNVTCPACLEPKRLVHESLARAQARVRPVPP